MTNEAVNLVITDKNNDKQVYEGVDKITFATTSNPQSKTPDGEAIFTYVSGTKDIENTNLVDVSKFNYAQIKDTNLKAENIKNNETILGITGSYSGEAPTAEITVNLGSTMPPKIDTPKKSVGFTLDTNAVKSEYIIPNKTILGVEGSANIGQNCNATASDIVLNKTALVNGIVITGQLNVDGNVNSSDILSGKYCYINGNKLTGNMPNLSGVQISSQDTSYTKLSGTSVRIPINANGYINQNSSLSAEIKRIIGALSELPYIEPRNGAAMYKVNSDGSCGAYRDNNSAHTLQYYNHYYTDVYDNGKRLVLVAYYM